ncbi:MAG: hypothetical protein CL678_15980 [Bdellovibrionaceae bacterium]|nr:hypothetical protein [Pseudobdellovibrionaceae bacterium]
MSKTLLIGAVGACLLAGDYFDFVESGYHGEGSVDVNHQSFMVGREVDDLDITGAAALIPIIRDYLETVWAHIFPPNNHHVPGQSVPITALGWTACGDGALMRSHPICRLH